MSNHNKPVLFFLQKILWHDIMNLPETTSLAHTFFEKSSHAKNLNKNGVFFAKIQFLKERICQAFVGNLRKQKKHTQISRNFTYSSVWNWCILPVMFMHAASKHQSKPSWLRTLYLCFWRSARPPGSFHHVFWWPSQPSILMEKPCATWDAKVQGFLHQQ